MRTHSGLSDGCRRRPLAAGLALVFGTGWMVATAAPNFSNSFSEIDLKPHVGMSSWTGESNRSVSPTNPDTTTLLVTSCADNVSGSLRDAIETASGLSGDVTIEFDLDQMQCSR